jgi:hypothetical protein
MMEVANLSTDTLIQKSFIELMRLLKDFGAALRAAH